MSTSVRGLPIVLGLVALVVIGVGATVALVGRGANPRDEADARGAVALDGPSATSTTVEADSPAVSTPLDAPSEPDDADTRRNADEPTPLENEFGEDGDAPSVVAPPCDVPTTSDASVGANTETPRIAGAIRGILLREGGAWTDATLPRGNTVILELVELKAPYESRRGVLEPVPDATGGYELRFEFPDLPEGDYELTLSALGSVRWAPTALKVRPPLSGVTFTRYDKDPRSPLAFEVRDARTDREITTFETRHVQLTPSDDAGVFLQTGPLDVDAFPIDARFTWSLWADGYAAAFGDETAFERRDDRRVARVRLEPGWSTRVLVLAKDPLARQVRGAEVVVDGRSAGFTDAAGMLCVRAAAQPTSLEVKYPGWTVQGDPLAPVLGKTAAQRAHTTIVFLIR